jgi:transposase
VEEVVEEPAELVERVAALDVGKATLVACVRVPHDAKPGRRRQEVRTFATTTRSLLELADWLYGLGVTRVVMESTSTYWKPPFYVLRGAVCVLAGERPRGQARAGPTQDGPAGRRLAGQAPPSGACSGAKLCTAAVAAGCCGPRPATGAPSSTSGPTRSSGWSRLLEDAQIKLSVVAADIFGVSGRDMLAALIAGEPGPNGARAAGAGQDALQARRVGAGALTGHFRAHHGYLLQMMPGRIDTLGAQIDQPGRPDRGAARPVRPPGDPAG